MREEDVRVFRHCATSLGLWILVRRTNPRSLKYIGQAGFAAKPIDCKAKTCDKGPLAGLVARFPGNEEMFWKRKQEDAAEAWAKFVKSLEKNNRGYTVDEDEKSKYRGCIRLGRDYIYGDYDLYDIVDPQYKRANLALVGTLHGEDHRRPRRFYEVQEFINHAMNADVIQHGGEAQYKDHTSQVIDVFGPNGEVRLLRTKAEIVRWYETKFEGRKTLGKNSSWI